MSDEDAESSEGSLLPNRLCLTSVTIHLLNSEDFQRTGRNPASDAA